MADYLNLSLRKAVPNPGKGKGIYTVKKGDTLWWVYKNDVQ
jgi:LysM repeat protein